MCTDKLRSLSVECDALIRGRIRSGDHQANARDYFSMYR